MDLSAALRPRARERAGVRPLASPHPRATCNGRVGPHRPTRHPAGRAPGFGQFGILIVLLNYGLQFMPSARGALIFATFPLMTMLLAAVLGKETLNRFKIAVSPQQSLASV